MGYIAALYGSSPWIKLFSGSPGAYTEITAPVDLPASSVTCGEFSPCGDYLALGLSGATSLIIYKRSGDTFTKLANPATMPGQQAYQLSWSQDSGLLCIVTSYGTALEIYSRSGDTFTRLTSPLGTLGYEPSRCSFGGNFLVIQSYESPCTHVYTYSGTTFTKITSTGINSYSDGGLSQIAVSKKSNYLAVVFYSGSPYIEFFKFNGSTFSELTQPTTIPSASGSGFASMADDGSYFAGNFGANTLFVYRNVSDTFTKLANPSSMPTVTSPTGVYMKGSGAEISIELTGSPYAYLYSISGDMVTKQTDLSGLASETTLVAFMTDPPQEFIPAISGGAVAGGTSPYRFNIFTHEVDGGAVTGGIASYTTIRVRSFVASGGAVAGGAADVVYNYARIDGIVPELFAVVDALVTPVVVVNGLVPELYANISTRGAIIDGIVPELYADITAQHWVNVEITGYVPLTYCDIQSHGRFYSIDGIVPELWADIKTEGAATTDVTLQFSIPIRSVSGGNDGLPVGGEFDFFVPPLHADIAATVSPDDEIVSFSRGDWR